MADLIKTTEVEPIVKELTIDELKERLSFVESEARKAYEARDKSKQKARELESSLEDTKKNQEIKLKEQGDYETLRTKLNEEQTKIKSQQDSLRKRAIKITMESLGLEHEITKPEYITLFNNTLELDDDLNPINLEVVKNEFIKFKELNPNLFKTKEQKLVPRVDNAGNRINPANMGDVKVTPLDIMKHRMDEVAQKKQLN